MSELRLNTDGHIIKLGADNDVTLTHVHNTGLLLNSTMQLQFNDSSQFINAPSATVLDINATDEVELNATLVDINANVEISGTATTTGVHTFTAVPVFPNNTVETADIQADAITGAKIADDAINSEHYTDGSIDTAHIADNQITLAKMAGGTDGNIISYDASGDPVAIATGSDGQVLTSTGAGSPPAFEALPSSGKILQVISKTITSNYSMTSGTTADVTGLTQAITMASASNHLLVLGNYVFRIGGNSATVNPGSNVFITDDSNNLKAGSYFLSHLVSNGQTPTWTATQCAYLTPGTTSEYTIKVRCNNASEGGLVQFYGSSNNSYSTNLTLMEIAA